MGPTAGDGDARQRRREEKKQERNVGRRVKQRSRGVVLADTTR